MLNSIKYGPLHSQNYYRIVKEKNRTYYEVYSLPRTETPPEDYTQVSFVCLRPDGAYEAPATVSSVCRYSRKKIGDMDDFHFHLLRHTYTTNLLSHGAAPKDVQELLGHSDVSTTMNIYAHATREAKRTSARLLDKVVGDGLKKVSLISSRKGKNEGKGQNRGGAKNAGNTSVFKGYRNFN